MEDFFQDRTYAIDDVEVLSLSWNSGLRFAFDPSQPPGSRVDPQFVKVGKFGAAT
jgi:hypothetical protein